MDPKDERLFYGIDFVNVIDDGGTIVNPVATIDVGTSGVVVTLNDITLSDTTKVLFRPSVASGDQSNEVFDEDGLKALVTITVDDATGKPVQRSGFLWIAQR